MFRLFQRLWNRNVPKLVLIIFFVVVGCSIPVAKLSPESTSTEVGVANITLPNAPKNPSLAETMRQVRFEHISVEDGLSQSSVYSIMQDSKGFMWFGTQDGLNKFDGYNFSVYGSSSGDSGGLSNTYIRVLYQDKDNFIWIGTDGGGLNRLDPITGKVTVYQNDPKDPHSLSSNHILAIYQDSRGILWIGTEGGGLEQFDPSTGKFYHHRNAPKEPHIIGSNTVRAICEDEEGNLWVGTDDGSLNRFDPSIGEFHRYLYPYALDDNSILAIYDDKEGILWIGTNSGGLARFDPEIGRFSYFHHDISAAPIRTIFEDKSRTLWVGTYGDGIFRYDPTTMEFIQYRNDPNDPHSLSNDWVISFYEDRSGALWIGTNGGGLNIFNYATEKFTHYKSNPANPDGLSNSFIWAIHEDQSGIVWFGTNGGGVSGYDQGSGKWYGFKKILGDPYSLSSNIIRSIYEDREGTLWIGTGDGVLNRFERSEKQFVHYKLGSTPISSMFEDSDGTLWIGTFGEGLFQYDESSDHFHSYPLGPFDAFSFIWTIRESKDGSLWIGSGGGGLAKLNRSAGLVAQYQQDPNNPKSLSNNFVLTLYEDQSGVLWIGTFGGGMNRFDEKNELFTSYREKDGLPNDVIYGILEDGEHNLWISTNYGISKFNPKMETFTNYDAGDGLQSNEFNAGAYYQSESGEMFFGGIYGVSSFFPLSIDVNPYKPPILLTSLTQGGEKVELAEDITEIDEITFRWPNNFFEFEFVALSYIQPEKNQYAYMLEGFDKDWNEIGVRRFGRYSDLPGGTYTLRLKGSNNNGIWNEDGISIKVTIIPPFWETQWFLSVVVFLVVGLIVGGYRLQTRSMKARSHELEALVRTKTAELLDANQLLQSEIAERERTEKELAQQAVKTAITSERNRLARDLHDAVTQTLFSASLIAEVLPRLWENNRPEGERRLSELRELTRGALAEMRTLLLELRPTALVEMELGDLLQQLAESVTGRARIPVTVSVEGTCNDMAPEVKITLYRIAQEALNNIVKYAGNCQAEMRLRCQKKGVELCIADDGTGFDVANIPPESLGLGIMRERVETIGATLRVRSQIGQGTEIQVTWNSMSGEQK